MAITHPRRIVPLLIATTLATGAISLTTTCAFAAPTTTSGITTDSDGPGSSLIKNYSKNRKLEKIGTNTTNTELLDVFSRIPISDKPKYSDGGVVAPGMDTDPNSDEVSMGPLVVAESRTGHARPGPIITDKTVSGGNGNSDDARGGDTQTGGNGNPDDARGGDTQTGGNGNPDDARGGDTQPPTGQTTDSNAAGSDPGPRQDIDYGIWTNPNPGPVVN